MSWFGIGPGCLPNDELGRLCGRLTLGYFLVGREVELVQGSLRSASLHSIVSVSSLAPFLQIGVLSLTSLFPSEVDRFQTQF